MIGYNYNSRILHFYEIANLRRFKIPSKAKMLYNVQCTMSRNIHFQMYFKLPFEYFSDKNFSILLNYF